MLFGGQMRRADGNRDGEACCLAHLALDAQLAAVQLDQLLHQRQADARSLVAAPALPLDAVEPLEDARQLVLRNADAGVVTARSARPSRPVTETTTLPASVNLNAFESRLRTIFSHMSRST